MEKTSKERKGIMASSGTWMWWGGVCWTLGVVFTVFGVISEATNISIGLKPMSWFLMAIAAFVSSIPEYIGWLVTVYLDSTEAKSKKK